MNLGCSGKRAEKWLEGCKAGHWLGLLLTLTAAPPTPAPFTLVAASPPLPSLFSLSLPYPSTSLSEMNLQFYSALSLAVSRCFALQKMTAQAGGASQVWI